MNAEKTTVVRETGGDPLVLHSLRGCQPKRVNSTEPTRPIRTGAVWNDRRTHFMPPVPGTVSAVLATDWPHADLLDVLPLQAAAARDEESFGVWVIIEWESKTLVGDIGFIGPPGDDRAVEIGYSVIPDRPGRGYRSSKRPSSIGRSDSHGWARSSPVARRRICRQSACSNASVSSSPARATANSVGSSKRPMTIRAEADSRNDCQAILKHISCSGTARTCAPRSGSVSVGMSGVIRVHELRGGDGVGDREELGIVAQQVEHLEIERELSLAVVQGAIPCRSRSARSALSAR